MDLFNNPEYHLINNNLLKNQLLVPWSTFVFFVATLLSSNTPLSSLHTCPLPLARQTFVGREGRMAC